VGGVFHLRQVGLFQFVFVEQVGKLVDEDADLGFLDLGQHAPVEPPDDFIAAAGVAVGVFLEFLQQLVEEGAFPRTGRSLEDVDLVLPGAALHRLHMIDQPVGKEPVGKEGAVGTFDEESAEIVVDEIYGFGVVGILVNAFADVVVDHVVKGLHDIAHHLVRPCRQLLQELIEGDDLMMFPFADQAVEMIQGGIDVGHKLIRSAKRLMPADFL